MSSFLPDQAHVHCTVYTYILFITIFLKCYQRNKLLFIIHYLNDF